MVLPTRAPHPTGPPPFYTESPPTLPSPPPPRIRIGVGLSCQKPGDRGRCILLYLLCSSCLFAKDTGGGGESGHAVKGWEWAPLGGRLRGLGKGQVRGSRVAEDPSSEG